MPEEGTWVRWDTHWTSSPSSVTDLLLASGKLFCLFGFQFFIHKRKMLNKHKPSLNTFKFTFLNGTM